MKNKDIYRKYPHIIHGSIEEVGRGIIIRGGKNNKITSHGKIAIIKCADINMPGCLETRIINIQDAEQTKYCSACTRRRKNERRRARRRQLKN